MDFLCGLVVRVPGYRSRDLASITEELLGRKIAASV
jgi:hypothetical protein